MRGHTNLNFVQQNKVAKFYLRLLTSRTKCDTFILNKKDCDEDGQKNPFSESRRRLKVGNAIFQETHRFRVGGLKAKRSVDASRVCRVSA